MDVPIKSVLVLIGLAVHATSASASSDVYTRLPLVSCDDSAECAAAQLTAVDSLVCTGTKACMGATAANVTDIVCSAGTSACGSMVVANGSRVLCDVDGSSMCKGLQASGTSLVVCVGDYSCDQAVVVSVAKTRCVGPYACQSANFDVRAGGSVECGYTAAVDIAAQSFDTSLAFTDFDDDAYQCFSATFTGSGTVVCDGKSRSCAGAAFSDFHGVITCGFGNSFDWNAAKQRGALSNSNNCDSADFYDISGSVLCGMGTSPPKDYPYSIYSWGQCYYADFQRVNSVVCRDSYFTSSHSSAKDADGGGSCLGADFVDVGSLTCDTATNLGATNPLVTIDNPPCKVASATRVPLVNCSGPRSCKGFGQLKDVGAMWCLGPEACMDAGAGSSVTTSGIGSLVCNGVSSCAGMEFDASVANVTCVSAFSCEELVFDLSGMRVVCEEAHACFGATFDFAADSGSVVECRTAGACLLATMGEDTVCVGSGCATATGIAYNRLGFLECDDTSECAAAQLTAVDSLVCTGTKACMGATAANVTDIVCSAGTSACSSMVVANGSRVLCDVDGSSMCKGLEASGTSLVVCVGDYSCDQAVVVSVAKTRCVGPYACQSANFDVRAGGSVECGYTAAVDIAAQSFDTSLAFTDFDDDAYQCFSATFTGSGTVVCDGKSRSCAGAAFSDFHGVITCGFGNSFDWNAAKQRGSLSNSNNCDSADFYDISGSVLCGMGTSPPKDYPYSIYSWGQCYYADFQRVNSVVCRDSYFTSSHSSAKDADGGGSCLGADFVDVGSLTCDTATNLGATNPLVTIDNPPCKVASATRVPLVNCSGPRSCKGFGQLKDVGAMWCLGPEACMDAGAGSSVTTSGIGSLVCNGVSSCAGMEFDASVANVTCVSAFSCEELVFDLSGMRVVCEEAHACFGATFDFAADSGSVVECRTAGACLLATMGEDTVCVGSGCATATGIAYNRLGFLECDDSAECAAAQLTAVDSLVCTGTKACMGATAANVTDIVCSAGTSACSSMVVANGSRVLCDVDGSSMCKGLEASGTSLVVCVGDYSCDQAVVVSVAKTRCVGPYACQSANFDVRAGGSVECGYTAAVDIAAQSFDTSLAFTDFDDDAYQCFSATFTGSGTVVCDGKSRSCAGAAFSDFHGVITCGFGNSFDWNAAKQRGSLSNSNNCDSADFYDISGSVLCGMGTSPPKDYPYSIYSWGQCYYADFQRVNSVVCRDSYFTSSHSSAKDADGGGSCLGADFVDVGSLTCDTATNLGATNPLVTIDNPPCKVASATRVPLVNCSGPRSCKSFGQLKNVGAMWCLGPEACMDAGAGSSVTTSGIGSLVCNGVSSCAGMEFDASVANVTCVSAFSCEELVFDLSGMRVVCEEAHACFGATFDFAADSGSVVECRTAGACLLATMGEDTVCVGSGCNCLAEGDDDGDFICSDVDSCAFDSGNDVDSDMLCGDDDSCALDPDNDVDSDLLCGDVDSCVVDTENDADSDAMCTDVDSCAYDSLNDVDSDLVCADVDSCPFDPTDSDSDSDGICDDVDSCVSDAENDIDTDSLCGNEDSCAYDAENDADSDLLCGDVDDDNDAIGLFSVVCGGADNTALGDYASIAGGQYGRAAGKYSFVGGGELNTASGHSSTALGANASASHDRAAVLGFSGGACESMCDGSVNICVDGGLFLNGKELSVSTDDDEGGNGVGNVASGRCASALTAVCS